MTTRTLPFLSPTRRIALLAAAVCLLSAAPVGAAEYYSLAGLKTAGFQKWLDDAKSQGYEILYVNGCQVGDHVEYAGVAYKYSNGKVQSEAHFDMTAEECKDYAKEMKDKSFHPVGASGYHTPDGPRFAVSWIKNKNEPQWDIKLNQTEKEFEKTLAEKRDAGMFPSQASAYQGNDGAVRFTTVFVAPNADQTYEFGYNLTAEKLRDQLDRWDSKDFHPVRIHAYDTPDGLRFLVIARTSPFDSARVMKVLFGLTGNQYQKEFDTLAKQGYNPWCICGYHDGGEVKFAVIWGKKK